MLERSHPHSSANTINPAIKAKPCTRIAAQKKTYQDEYSEEEIAEAVGLLEQTMLAFGEASVPE